MFTNKEQNYSNLDKGTFGSDIISEHPEGEQHYVTVRGVDPEDVHSMLFDIVSKAISDRCAFIRCWPKVESEYDIREQITRYGGFARFTVITTPEVWTFGRA